jgi:hypothetical protein
MSILELAYEFKSGAINNRLSPGNVLEIHGKSGKISVVFSRVEIKRSRKIWVYSNPNNAEETSKNPYLIERIVDGKSTIVAQDFESRIPSIEMYDAVTYYAVASNGISCILSGEEWEIHDINLSDNYVVCTSDLSTAYTDERYAFFPLDAKFESLESLFAQTPLYAIPKLVHENRFCAVRYNNIQITINNPGAGGCKSSIPKNQIKKNKTDNMLFGAEIVLQRDTTRILLYFDLSYNNYSFTMMNPEKWSNYYWSGIPRIGEPEISAADKAVIIQAKINGFHRLNSDIGRQFNSFTLNEFGEMVEILSNLVG